MTSTHIMCPECGGFLKNKQTCWDHFYQVLAWDFEDPAGTGSCTTSPSYAIAFSIPAFILLRH